MVTLQEWERVNVSPRAEHPVYLVMRCRPLHVLQDLLLQVGFCKLRPNIEMLLPASRSTLAWLLGDHMPAHAGKGACCHTTAVGAEGYEGLHRLPCQLQLDG